MATFQLPFPLFQDGWTAVPFPTTKQTKAANPFEQRETTFNLPLDDYLITPTSPPASSVVSDNDETPVGSFVHPVQPNNSPAPLQNVPRQPSVDDLFKSFRSQLKVNTRAQPISTEKRYIALAGVPTMTSTAELSRLFLQDSVYGPIRAILTDHLASHGVVILAFYDSRHSALAVNQLPYETRLGRSLRVTGLTREEVGKILSESEGRVIVTVQSVTTAVVPSVLVLQHGLRQIGTLDILLDLQLDIEVASSALIQTRVTFFDDRHVVSAVKRLQDQLIMGCRFSVTLDPLIIEAIPPLIRLRSPIRSYSYGTPVAPSFDRSSSCVRTNSNDSFKHSVPIDNLIDLRAIEQGHDKRTTSMMKNLPNKMSNAKIIAMLEETCPGGFDFVYTRIDFQTGASVGYSFVNFLTPFDLLRFARARLGTKWDPSTSEKVVYVSYANIQGKQALINKFRNSAVMNERDEYQPKVFHSSGPLKGLPEEFPLPDDIAMLHAGPRSPFGTSITKSRFHFASLR